MAHRVERASVYRTKKGYFLHALSRTPDGIWVASLPALLVALDVSNQDLGAAVSTTLAGSSELTYRPDPSDFGPLTAPVLKASGLRSWTALQKDGTLCTVSRDTKQIAITPTRNAGVTGRERGYHDLQEAESTLQLSSSASELGAAIKESMKRCA